MTFHFAGMNANGSLIPDGPVSLKTFTAHEMPGFVDLRAAYTFSVFRHRDNELYLNGRKKVTLAQRERRDFDFDCTDKSLYVLHDNELHVYDALSIDCSALAKSEFLDLKSDDTLARINVGYSIICATTTCGQIVSTDAQIFYDGDGIADLSIGNEHAIILDKSGNVYTFGTNSRGQLGHGNLKNLSRPQIVEALGGVKIIAVSAGGWHSCALSSTGDIYAWGWNDKCQLGINSDCSSLATPILMQTPLELIFNQICCGSKHTLALTKNGEVFGCGSNDFFQLGTTQSDIFREMTSLLKLENIDGMSMKLRCGPYNSAVIVSELGDK